MNAKFWRHVVKRAIFFHRKEAHVQVVCPDVLPAPTNVRLRRISSTAVEVSWDAPYYHQNVVGYRVYYHTSPSADIADWQSVEIGPHTMTEVGGLAPNTLYAFRVRAKAADNRYGNFSSVVVFRRHDSGMYKTWDRPTVVLGKLFEWQLMICDIGSVKHDRKVHGLRIRLFT